MAGGPIQIGGGAIKTPKWPRKCPPRANATPLDRKTVNKIKVMMMISFFIFIYLLSLIILPYSSLRLQRSSFRNLDANRGENIHGSFFNNSLKLPVCIKV